MRMEPTKQQLVEYLRNLAKLHQDVTEGSISDEEYAERLAPLKAEHQLLTESGAFPLDMRFALQSSPSSPTKHVHKLAHPLDFKCQCKTCVRMHTITMADKGFLGKCGATWSK